LFVLCFKFLIALGIFTKDVCAKNIKIIKLEMNNINIRYL